MNQVQVRPLHDLFAVNDEMNKLTPDVQLNHGIEDVCKKTPQNQTTSCQHAPIRH